MPTPLARFLRKPAALVFFSAFVLQTLVLSRHAASHQLVPASDDMKFYLDWATRIAGGQWTDHHAFYGLPGYAYWLGALLLITGGDGTAACLITGGLQTVAFAGVASLVFILTRDAVRSGTSYPQLDASEKEATIVATIAAIGWILFVPAQTYTVILMPTVSVVLAYWAGIRFISRVSATTPNWAWLLLGLLIGVTALFIATIFFLLPLAFFAILRETGRNFEKPRWPLHGVAATVALLGGIVAGCSPAWIHNFVVARDPVMLSAHSGINMWIGNNPTANGYPKIPQGLPSGQEALLKESLSIPQRTIGRTMPRSEISQFWNAKARSWIKQNPAIWLRLVGTKLENFWNAFQYDDINVLRLLRSDGTTWGFSSFGIISTLGLAGALIAAWQLPYSRWAIAGVLLHMLALIPVFVTERYRLAAVPGLLVCASLGIWLLWNSLGTAKWGTAAAYLLLVTGAAAFTSIPKGDAGAWALSHYNMGTRTLAIAEQASAAKDWDLASYEFSRSQDELRIAFAYAPESTEINLAFGNLWMAKRDAVRARLFYERVLAIDSMHLSALNNLGIIALEERQWNSAIVLFAKALEIHPGSPKLHYLMAKAKLGDGDINGAIEAVDKAIAIQPSQREFSALREQLKQY